MHNTSSTPSSGVDQDIEYDTFLSHLRTVHFSLVVTAFVLVVATTLSRSPKAERAFEDLLEISDVVANWDPELSNHVLPAVAERHAEATGELRRLRLTIAASNAHPEVRVVLHEPLWVPGDLELMYLFQPKNLAEFAQMWDRLATSVEVFIPSDLFGQAASYRYHEGFTGKWGVETLMSSQGDSTNPDDNVATDMGRGKRALGWDEGRQEGDPTLCIGSLDEMNGELIQFWKGHISNRAVHDDLRHHFTCSVGSFSNPFGWWRVSLPAHTFAADEIDGQEIIRKKFRVDWHKGPFSRAFPELSEITGGTYDSLPFDRIEKILDGERRRSDERLEIMGTGLPASEVARWGGLCAVLMYMYLFMHLNRLVGFLSDRGVSPIDISYPWIGIYPSRWARLGTLFSIVFLPPGALLWVGIVESGARVFVLCLLIVGVLISRACRRDLRQMWSNCAPGAQGEVANQG